jgi:hypothetical protein
MPQVYTSLSLEAQVSITRRGIANRAPPREVLTNKCLDEATVERPGKEFDDNRHPQEFQASGSRRKGHDVAHGILRVRLLRQTRPSS